MEFIDLYDADRNVKIKHFPRGEKFENGLFNAVVHICLFNSEGKMLIQQRHKSKKNFPEVWDLSLGGGVQSGETPRDACKRELLEELGILHDFSNERPLFTFNFQKGFDDYFAIEKDVDLKDVKFVDGEVQNVSWASEEEILELIASGKFINYYPSLIKFIFDTRKSRNAFKI